MAKLTKTYEFIKGEDWFYDRAIFDRLSIDANTAKIEMSEGEFMALEAIRKLCHDELGDDYNGPLPEIELAD
jgi:hypothetical protein